MVNILLESFDIDAEYLRPELEKYIKRGNKVVIIAFSFRDREPHINRVIHFQSQVLTITHR